MSIRESDLVSMISADFTADDNVRVMDSSVSRKITLQRFTESQQSILEALGFVTTTSSPSEFSQIRNVKTKTENYTATLSDSVILCDTTIESFTITLPSTASAHDVTNSTGQMFTVKRTSSDGNSVTIAPIGADLIDGDATMILLGPLYTEATFISDGNNWWVI